MTTTLFHEPILVAIVFGPLLLAVLAALFIVLRYGRVSSLMPRLPSCEAVLSSLKSGLSVQLAQELSVSSLIAAQKGTSTAPDALRTPSVLPHPLDIYTPIAPSSEWTEGDIRECYPLASAEAGDGIVLVLRLTCALYEFGHSSVDAETLGKQVGVALGMPAPIHLDISHRTLTAVFCNGPVHLISVKRGFHLSRLGDVTSLATAIIVGEATGACCALAVLERLLERPEPYGWIVRLLCVQLLAPFATLAAYLGSYYDTVGAALIASPVVVVVYFCSRFHLQHIEPVLVALTIGTVTPLVWMTLHPSGDNTPPCHMVHMYMGVLLLWLPGSELIYGAHELRSGSIVNGAARLIKGLANAMILAVFLTVGWQFFGRGLYVDTDLSVSSASLPPSLFCSNVSTGLLGGEAAPGLWAGQVVWTIPLILSCLVAFQIRIRDMAGPLVVGLVVLAVQGTLNVYCEDPDQTCQIPLLVANVYVAFVAGSVASVHELLSGIPAFVSLIPIVLILAPGSGAVLATMGAIHRSTGDADANPAKLWETLVLQGITYMGGIYLSFELFRPLLAIQVGDLILRFPD